MKSLNVNPRSAVLALLVAGASIVPLTASPADEPVKVNVILPLTGPAAFLGKQEQIAMQIGEKLINAGGGIGGRPVQFVFFDDQTNPQISVQLFGQIVATKPAVILGPSSTSSCSAVAPLVRDGPLVYCFSPGLHPERGSYAFSSSVGTEDVGRAQVLFLTLKGITRTAMISSTDASGQDGERGFLDTIKRPEYSKLQLIQPAHYNPSDLSVAAQLEQIKAAQPQFLVVQTTGTPLATVLKGMVQVGLDVPVITGYGNMTNAQMNDYAGFLPKELYFANGIWPYYSGRPKLAPAIEAAQKRMYDAYATAGSSPDVAATLAWDPMMIVVDALRKLGPAATPMQLRDYLENIKGYAGVNGIYDFGAVPQRGLAVENVEVTRWDPARKSWIVMSKPGILSGR